MHYNVHSLSNENLAVLLAKLYPITFIMEPLKQRGRESE